MLMWIGRADRRDAPYGHIFPYPLRCLQCLSLFGPLSHYSVMLMYFVIRPLGVIVELRFFCPGQFSSQVVSWKSEEMCPFTIVCDAAVNTSGLRERELCYAICCLFVVEFSTFGCLSLFSCANLQACDWLSAVDSERHERRFDFVTGVWTAFNILNCSLSVIFLARCDSS